MSSGRGSRKRQEFLSLASTPFSEAGTCRKSKRSVQEVAAEVCLGMQKIKKGCRQNHHHKTKQNTEIKHCIGYF